MRNSEGPEGSGQSDESDKSDRSDKNHSIIPKHGGFRKLRSHKAALQIYDATVLFCDRFINLRSRTHDQMVQAARSGVRNIEEGSAASATSKKTELKLTNVAKASLLELLGNCEDFLRHRGLPVWDKDSPEAISMRRRLAERVSDRSDQSDMSDLSEFIKTARPQDAANCLLCLIHQATYLLRRQIEWLEQDFLEKGGFTESLYRERRRARDSDRSDRSDMSDTSDQAPACPRCGKRMRLRTTRRGRNAGSRFWGCSGYPDCTATRPYGDRA